MFLYFPHQPRRRRNGSVAFAAHFAGGIRYGAGRPGEGLRRLRLGGVGAELVSRFFPQSAPPAMKTYFLFHDKWAEYIKADWAASRFPFDGFVVVEKTRAGLAAFLLRRMRRLGFRKVADELLLRFYYVLFQGRRDGRMLRQFMAEVQRDIPASYRRPPVHRV